MKSAVVVFPASNCDRDAKVALEQMTGNAPHMVWHQDSELPDVDLVVLPGGFIYVSTGMFAAANSCLSARALDTLKWKMLAARAASALPRVKTSAK